MFRLNHNSVDSPLCRACLLENDSQHHRYIFCQAVSQGWNKTRELINSLDQDLLYETDFSLLNFYFSPTLRENAVIWLIGEFVTLVENEVVNKHSRLSRRSVENCLKARKLECQHMALPDMGLIPGLNPTGIG